jgi:dihydroxyacid dehydratase/phosphogluconate dehydratase
MKCVVRSSSHQEEHEQFADVSVACVCSDTSGISVCFGNVQDPKLLHQAQVALDQMGARYSDKIQIDTTHFVCTTPAGPTGRCGPLHTSGQLMFIADALGLAPSYFSAARASSIRRRCS